MTVETLSSNVVNYLIWRYLQEAGFGSAAVQLSRAWEPDPQTLPFAGHIKKSALIELIQDGLYLDTLQSEATGDNPRWSFGADHGRKFSIQRAGGPMLHPDAVDMNNNSSIEMNGYVPEGTTKKASRKKKKSNGPERTNGDIMDLEPNGIHHAPSRGESEAVISDAESPIVEEIPLPTTLNEGRSLDIQTEKIAELAPTSKILKREKPIKRVSWNPNSDDKDMLLVAGRSTLSLYRVPTSQASDLNGTDLKIPHDQYEVLAACWKGPDVVAAALHESTHNENGESWSTFKMIAIQGEDYRLISSTVGMVSHMRWSGSNQLLLTVSTSDINGSLMIWSADLTESAILSTNRPVFDAQWVSDRQFVVCGDGLLNVYDFLPEAQEIRLHKEFSVTGCWDKVAYDPICGYIACKSMDGDVLGLTRLEGQNVHIWDCEDAPITDLSFQPISNPGSHEEQMPRLLAATSHDTGVVHVYNVKQGFQEIYRVELGDGRPGNAVSFSPDGYLLAAAGIDTVLIWQADRGGRALAQWHGSADQQWDVPNSQAEVEELEHTLAWDVDGKKLVYSMGKQLAIINFQR